MNTLAFILAILVGIYSPLFLIQLTILIILLTITITKTVIEEVNLNTSKYITDKNLNKKNRSNKKAKNEKKKNTQKIIQKIIIKILFKLVILSLAILSGLSLVYFKKSNIENIYKLDLDFQKHKTREIGYYIKLKERKAKKEEKNDEKKEAKTKAKKKEKEEKKEKKNIEKEKNDKNNKNEKEKNNEKIEFTKEKSEKFKEYLEYGSIDKEKIEKFLSENNLKESYKIVKKELKGTGKYIVLITDVSEKTFEKGNKIYYYTANILSVNNQKVYKNTAILIKFKYKHKLDISKIHILTGRLNKFLESTNYRGFNEKLYNYSKGISFNISDVTLIKSIELEDIYSKKEFESLNFTTLEKIVLKLKSEISILKESIKLKICERKLKNEEEILAIILGEKLKDEETKENFKDLNIYHLLVISGTHISIYIILLEYILKFSKVPKIIKEILKLFFLTSYILLLNFSSSILRVYTIYLISNLLKLLNLRIHKRYIIFVSILIVLALNPFRIVDIGFWLSFLGMYGILFANELVKMFGRRKITEFIPLATDKKTLIRKVENLNFKARVKKRIKESVFTIFKLTGISMLVSIIIYILIFPILMYYFNEINLNLIFIPILTPLFTIIIGVSMLLVVVYISKTLVYIFIQTIYIIYTILLKHILVGLNIINITNISRIFNLDIFNIFEGFRSLEILELLELLQIVLNTLLKILDDIFSKYFVIVENFKDLEILNYLNLKRIYTKEIGHTFLLLYYICIYVVIRLIKELKKLRDDFLKYNICTTKYDIYNFSVFANISFLKSFLRKIKSKEIVLNLRFKKIVSIYLKVLVILIILCVLNYQYLYKFNKTSFVSFIDVMQGDCSVITTSEGNNILIDSGDRKKEGMDYGKKVVLPYLLHRNISKIDYLILSHLDSDHAGGSISIIKNIEVKKIYLPKIDYKNCEKIHLYYEIKQLAKEKNIKIQYLSKGDELNLKDLSIKVLMPKDGQNISKNYLNNNSLVFLVSIKNNKVNKDLDRDFKILYTGDIEKEAEKMLIKILKEENIKKVDVLKVAHHGSNTSTSYEFLKNLQISHAVISCGRLNKFIHPDIDVIKRLETFGIIIKRTDKLGEIYYEIK